MSHRAESVDFIFPEDLNHHGTLFGGKIAKQMSKTASIVATRYAYSKILLVSINNFTFLSPVNLGDTFRIVARAIGTGRTSIEVRADGYTQDPLGGVEQRACFAYFTFVKLSQDNQPLPVEPFAGEETEELKLVREIKLLSRKLQDVEE
ncbi:acyl-CoA thioesterase [Desulfurispira natronophila]|uniref:Acyl-CoA hydrolase n=1 Tax=Desulfurispira natronophila TaxID=682562 RepID=A0A7W7Y4T6_9BACT|nr:hotdog domain-containing protein [Desulfurispira natronophila]MBB5022090.1 acyl-CoA hydrolase [Desulfurispira natronophila]